MTNNDKQSIFNKKVHSFVNGMGRTLSKEFSNVANRAANKMPKPRTRSNWDNELDNAEQKSLRDYDYQSSLKKTEEKITEVGVLLSEKLNKKISDLSSRMDQDFGNETNFEKVSSETKYDHKIAELKTILEDDAPSNVYDIFSKKKIVDEDTVFYDDVASSDTDNEANVSYSDKLHRLFEANFRTDENNEKFSSLMKGVNKSISDLSALTNDRLSKWADNDSVSANDTLRKEVYYVEASDFTSGSEVLKVLDEHIYHNTSSLGFVEEGSQIAMLALLAARSDGYSFSNITFPADTDLVLSTLDAVKDFLNDEKSLKKILSLDVRNAQPEELPYILEEVEKGIKNSNGVLKVVLKVKNLQQLPVLDFEKDYAGAVVFGA